MHDFLSKYGSWAIVAGASEGLGAAFAEELAKRGLNLVLLARRFEKREDLSKYLVNCYQIKTEYYSIDLADAQKVKQLFRQLNLDIGLLVYNAAYAPIGYFTNITEENLERTVNVNIKTPLILSRLVADRMIEKRKGGIILMSSLAGIQGTPRLAAYSASKAFNAILAEALWKELEQHGIDVIASCPGAIRTPGYKNAQQSKDAPGTLDAKQVAIKTLDALGKGPLIIPGYTNKIARLFMGRLLPRKFAVTIMEKQTKNLI